MIKNGLNEYFSEVGKIKIGGKGKTIKSKNGKDFQQPIKFEHFVVTTTEKGPDGNFVRDDQVMADLGPAPKEISIRLPFDDIDMNFHTSFQMYQGHKCKCRGDGEVATQYHKDGSEKQINCNPDSCSYLKDNKCKVSGILSCHIKCSHNTGGIYRLRTHSWNSVSGMLKALKYFAQNTNGILQGLPLKLKFLKKSTVEHGNVNIVTIVMDGLELLQMRTLALEEIANRKLLGVDIKQIEIEAVKTGFLDDTDDPGEVQEEFYAEPEVIEPVKGVSSENAKEELLEKLLDKKEENNNLKGDLL